MVLRASGINCLEFYLTNYWLFETKWCIFSEGVYLYTYTYTYTALSPTFKGFLLLLLFLLGGFLELVFRCLSCRLANLKLYNYIKTFWFWGITIVFGGEIVIHYYYSLISYTIPIYIYICLQVLILEIFTVFSFLVSHHCEQSPLLLTFTTWIPDH